MDNIWISSDQYGAVSANPIREARITTTKKRLMEYMLRLSASRSGSLLMCRRLGTTAGRERGRQRENPSGRGLVQSQTTGPSGNTLVSIRCGRTRSRYTAARPLEPGRARARPRAHTHTSPSHTQGCLGGVTTNATRQVRAVGRARTARKPHTCTRAAAREGIPDQTSRRRTFSHLPPKAFATTRSLPERR